MIQLKVNELLKKQKKTKYWFVKNIAALTVLPEWQDIQYRISAFGSYDEKYTSQAVLPLSPLLLPEGAGAPPESATYDVSPFVYLPRMHRM